MKKLCVICCFAFLLTFFCASASAQRAKSALLPTSQAKTLANQCSRPSPEKFTDTWEPSKAEIEKMEAKLSNISGLRAKGCCMEGATIENPKKWYMQYVGIVLGGKKLIYVSAFATTDPGDKWKDFAIVICDGGNAWGVLYDSVKGKFFDLAVNGVG